MFGERGATDLNELASDRIRRSVPTDSENPDDRGTTESTATAIDTRGMIPRTIAAVFDQIVSLSANDNSQNIEYMVRCSFVEIYLEKIFDLLHPSRDGIFIKVNDNGDSDMVGASELCCVDAEDVYALLARGQANRMQSATRQNQDSSRSHAVFTMTLRQIDRSTGLQRSSKLYMVDLAGSEQGRTKSSRQLDNPVALEGRMVNASLQTLQNHIRGTLVEQGKEKGRINPTKAYANASKLTRLLKPCFGGNCCTTLICTASPSSYNIDETLSTLKFAQRVSKLQNSPMSLSALSMEACQERTHQAELQSKNLSRFATSLALECSTLRKTGKVQQPQNTKMWEAISMIAQKSSTEDGDDLDIVVLSRDEDTTMMEPLDEVERERMAKLVDDHKQARAKAESMMREYQSECTSLRAQHEFEAKEIKRLEHELTNAKSGNEALASRQEELESDLRTSKFRENEAIVFLRQFRSYYMRLLKTKASQGSGDTGQILQDHSKDIACAPDLVRMLDVDRMMMKSGLLEPNEIGDDAQASKHRSSEAALQRSSAEATEAQRREKASVDSFGSSVLSRPESSLDICYRQRLSETPAGKLAIQKEKELEEHLTMLSQKCTVLQNSVAAEKAMVGALSTKQGAIGKMNAARESTMLKTELDRRTNDLQAIIWKMNELHLVNKTIDEKLESRENQVLHLEKQIAILQTNNSVILLEKHEAEKKLKEEHDRLQNEIDGLSVGIWQLGDETPTKLPKSKFILPCTGSAFDDLQEVSPRSVSVGGIDVELDFQAHESLTTMDSTTQTDTEKSPVNEMCTQTDGNFMEEQDKKDASMQTETSVSVDVSIQTESEEESTQIEVLTATEEVGTQTFDASPNTKLIDVSAQTDILPSEGGLHDSISIIPGEEWARSPKPVGKSWQQKVQTRCDSRRSINSTDSETTIHDESVASFDLHGATGTEARLSSSMRWSGAAVPPVRKKSNDRLGSSMSAMYGPATKTNDWRIEAKNIRIRQQANSSKPVPEFLSKFKEMGIRADDSEDQNLQDDETPPPARTSTKSMSPVPKWKKRTLESPGLGTPTTHSTSSSSSTSSTSKVPSRKNSSGGKAAPPEWMKKFQEIGQKSEERVI
ncbi:MAG: hypothetical protein SGILL_005293 [Bacillariaceae sp.]